MVRNKNNLKDKKNEKKVNLKRKSNGRGNSHENKHGIKCVYTDDDLCG